MACSAILVLDLKGRVLLARDYRGDIPLKYAERFISKVNELEDAGKLTPVIVDEGVTYLYVQVSPADHILTCWLCSQRLLRWLPASKQSSTVIFNVPCKQRAMMLFLAATLCSSCW